MLRKNNFYLIILAQILFLILIFVAIPTIFLKEKPGVSQISFENILPLDIDHSYVQSFISDRNNLNSISVQLKNPSLKNNDLVDLEIKNKNQESVQSLRIYGSNIGDPSWVRFKFPAINSQKGDTFYLSITSNNQTKDSLYIYGSPNGKDINFQTTFKNQSTKDSFKENLNEQINKFKSRNTFQSLLYLSLIIIINIFIFKLS